MSLYQIKYLRSFRYWSRP